jgi:hypothetical protein
MATPACCETEEGPQAYDDAQVAVSTAVPQGKPAHQRLLSCCCASTVSFGRPAWGE